MQPRAIETSFYKYEQTSISENYEYQQIAMARVDNTSNYATETKLTALVPCNGSVSASITTGFGLSGEIDAMFESVSASTDLSVSMRVPWCAGASYSIGTKIPAQKVGYLQVYKIGVSTSGVSTYRQRNVYTNQVTYAEQYSSASFPTHDINMKISIEDN